jgi:predicted TPR repeat methyltransferase
VAGEQPGSAVRLSAAGRLAALHEERGETNEAVAAYRNLLDADDPELIAAAKSRIAELEGSN